MSSEEDVTLASKPSHSYSVPPWAITLIRESGYGPSTGLALLAQVWGPAHALPELRRRLQSRPQDTPETRVLLLLAPLLCDWMVARMPKEFGAWAWIRSTGDTLSASVVSEAAAILNPASSRNEPWSALDGLGTKILQMEELPGPDALVHACASNGPAMPINPEDRLKAPKPAEAQWSWLRKRAAFAGGRRISSMANVGGVACGLVFLGLVLAYHEMRMSIPAAAAPTGQALPIEKSEQPTNDSTLPGERANPEFKPE